MNRQAQKDLRKAMNTLNEFLKELHTWKSGADQMSLLKKHKPLRRSVDKLIRQVHITIEICRKAEERKKRKSTALHFENNDAEQLLRTDELILW